MYVIWIMPAELPTPSDKKLKAATVLLRDTIQKRDYAAPMTARASNIFGPISRHLMAQILSLMCAADPHQCNRTRSAAQILTKSCFASHNVGSSWEKRAANDHFHGQPLLVVAVCASYRGACRGKQGVDRAWCTNCDEHSTCVGGWPIGYGRSSPHRAHGRSISDFANFHFIVRGRDECPFGSEHSPIPSRLQV